MWRQLVFHLSFCLHQWKLYTPMLFTTYEFAYCINNNGKKESLVLKGNICWQRKLKTSGKADYVFFGTSFLYMGVISIDRYFFLLLNFYIMFIFIMQLKFQMDTLLVMFCGHFAQLVSEVDMTISSQEN